MATLPPTRQPSDAPEYFFLCFLPFSSGHGPVYTIPMPVLSILYRYCPRAIPCTTTSQSQPPSHILRRRILLLPLLCFPLAWVGRHFYLTFSRVVDSRCKGFFVIFSSWPQARHALWSLRKMSMHIEEELHYMLVKLSSLARQLQTLASQVSSGLGVTVFARRDVATLGAVALWSRETM